MHKLAADVLRRTNVPPSSAAPCLTSNPWPPLAAAAVSSSDPAAEAVWRAAVTRARERFGFSPEPFISLISQRPIPCLSHRMLWLIQGGLVSTSAALDALAGAESAASEVLRLHASTAAWPLALAFISSIACSACSPSASMSPHSSIASALVRHLLPPTPEHAATQDIVRAVAASPASHLLEAWLRALLQRPSPYRSRPAAECRVRCLLTLPPPPATAPRLPRRTTPAVIVPVRPALAMQSKQAHLRLL